MLNYIKNIFKTKKDDELTEKFIFDSDEEKEISYEFELPEDFDIDKDTLLIIDDDRGMTSFLKDDIICMDEDGIVNLNEINLLIISGDVAAYNLEYLYNKYPEIKIKWAIIDITFGGTKISPKGNIIYNGVNIYELIKKAKNTSDDFRFVFYTGNNLNPYIRTNKKMIDKFNDLSGENIEEYLLFKTSMDTTTRRIFFKEKLFT